MRGRDAADEKRLLWIWKLPVVNPKDFGKVGPAFGAGAGCGLGFGGGMGIGPGIPGFRVGFGFGAGCGIGLGFGYGVGKGIAQDESRRYSNVGDPFHGSRTIPSEDDITGLADEHVMNGKKLIKVTAKEFDKWRR
ncbi:uncharacterized protein LOC129299767 [Prosopis cineraria]|uniref:uncharacterized protein LOC129299767 n=1 Tax=Prosopis cineraria TaxID=364024 RepID=UPI00240F088F|nr:uncharacterized protein LOC129299767 [Prosopis cineraria]